MSAAKLVKLACVPLLLLLAACGDDPIRPSAPGSDTVTTKPNIFQGAISEPMAVVSNAAVASRLGSTSPTQQVYVAFASGELPNAQYVRISNRSANSGVLGSYAIVDGALDPVSVAASVGDTLQLELTMGDGAVTFMRAAVPAKRAPRIIRTQPPQGRTDVALNARILLVFSEPIDPATLTDSTVQLLVAGQPVPGRVVPVSGSAVSAEFVPAQQLTANTSYTLAIRQGVQDVGGDSLQESVDVQFSTGETVGPTLAPTVNIETDTANVTCSNAAVARIHCLAVTPGGTLQLTAVLKDENGNTLSRGPVVWRSSNPEAVTVSATGVVTGMACGNDRSQSAIGAYIDEYESSITIRCDFAPGNGSIRVTVMTSGDDVPGDYAVRLDGGSTQAIIAANSNFTFAGVPTGIHSVTLTALPEDCTTTSNVTDIFAIPVSGATAHVNFAATCDRGGPMQSLGNQQIAFVRGNDIFAVTAEGSDEVRLTNIGANRSPAWSPAGNRLAFESARDGSYGLFIRNADGSVVRRTDLPTGKPAWSPDGHTMAFTSAGQIQIMASDDDGSNPVPVTQQEYVADPSWSPDGRRIAFVTDYASEGLYYEIVVMDTDGSDPRQLTALLSPRSFLPAWSPDGSRIAFVYEVPHTNYQHVRYTVAVMNADGSGVRDLAWAGDMIYAYSGRGPGSLAWSPDGSRIAFTFLDCDRIGATGCTNRLKIKYVTVDGTEQGILVEDGHSPTWRR
jgi:hypothetical protein